MSEKSEKDLKEKQGRDCGGDTSGTGIGRNHCGGGRANSGGKTAERT